jgi:acetyl-CoA carboxylase biotin carboxyl carrier protein
VKRVDAIWRDHHLLSPQVGQFEAALAPGDLVRGGDTIGWLHVLGVAIAVVAPPAAHGIVRAVTGIDRARVPVDCDHLLYVVDPEARLAEVVPSAATAAAAASGLVFAAPTSGRFYGRPSPDKPAFVEPGTVLAAGTTICLLEVMKTFHRVTYGGAGLPDRARVTGVLVVEGADVSAGDPLLALEPTS